MYNIIQHTKNDISNSYDKPTHLHGLSKHFHVYILYLRHYILLLDYFYYYSIRKNYFIFLYLNTYNILLYNCYTTNSFLFIMKADA